MKLSDKLKDDLKTLQDNMNYKDGTEILLALSVASNNLTRCIAMFPEVSYLDVIANTNRQKRDLFLMVVKDSNGQTFIRNITAIPSGQCWVYAMIYKNF